MAQGDDSFFCPHQDYTAEKLASILKHELKPYSLGPKLTAQSCCGATIMNSEGNSVQMKIKEIFSHLHFNQCHTHSPHFIKK
jgi:hypothetical protein